MYNNECCCCCGDEDDCGVLLDDDDEVSLFRLKLFSLAPPLCGDISGGNDDGGIILSSKIRECWLLVCAFVCVFVDLTPRGKIGLMASCQMSFRVSPLFCHAGK